jgi:signal peptidase I
MTTFALVTILLVLIALALAGYTAALLLGLRLVKSTDRSLKKSIAAVLLMQLVAIATSIVGATPQTFGLTPSTTVQVLLFVTTVAASAAIIRLCFPTLSLLRVLAAWIPVLFTGVLLLALSFFVVRPFLVEAYSIPTNSMAPTLVGLGWTGICPDCGSPIYGTSYAGPLGDWIREPHGICDKFHVSNKTADTTERTQGDHILAVKWLKPRRWDLVVYRQPDNPETLYVKRLVGLPGETVTIEDGAININGKRAPLPENLRGVQYATVIDGKAVNWGTVDQPAELKDDEYFVLGDNTYRALDSRLWQSGADGHSAYALPGENLVGVVTHIYWPPSRWRAFGR